VSARRGCPRRSRNACTSELPDRDELLPPCRGARLAGRPRRSAPGRLSVVSHAAGGRLSGELQRQTVLIHALIRCAPCPLQNQLAVLDREFI
jgi:hypothetical protein